MKTLNQDGPKVDGKHNAPGNHKRKANDFDIHVETARAAYDQDKDEDAQPRWTPRRWRCPGEPQSEGARNNQDEDAQNEQTSPRRLVRRTRTRLRHRTKTTTSSRSPGHFFDFKKSRVRRERRQAKSGSQVQEQSVTTEFRTTSRISSRLTRCDPNESRLTRCKTE